VFNRAGDRLLHLFRAAKRFILAYEISEEHVRQLHDSGNELHDNSNESRIPRERLHEIVNQFVLT